LVSQKRDEPALAEILSAPGGALASKTPQSLVPGSDQRGDQLASIHDLAQQRRWHALGGGRNDHGVEGLTLRSASASVPHQHHHPGDIGPIEVPSRLGCQVRDQFYPDDPRRPSGSQQRRQVTTPQAHLEDCGTGAQVDCLEHDRDDPGLRAGLSESDRERTILVAPVALVRGKEGMARNALEGGQGGAADALLAQRLQQLGARPGQLSFRIWMQWSTSWEYRGVGTREGIAPLATGR
jgi:hypothetical protein